MALAAASTIFRWKQAAIRPIAIRSLSAGGWPAERRHTPRFGPVDRHQIDLRLPYSYPTSPPDIRWLTPLWHPSVSFSGFVNLADIGLSWDPDLTLDVVCERLWDIARAAFIPEKATNFAAKSWYEQQCSYQLPLDQRRLRDWASRAGRTSCVMSGRPVKAFASRAVSSSEVFFIGDDTIAPPLPPRQPYVPIGRRRENQDVFYIGPNELRVSSPMFQARSCNALSLLLA